MTQRAVITELAAMTQPQPVIRSTLISVTAVTRNGTETETAEGVRETTPTVTRQRRGVARGRCRPLLHNNTHSRPCLGDITDFVYTPQLGCINNQGRHVRALQGTEQCRLTPDAAATRSVSKPRRLSQQPSLKPVLNWANQCLFAEHTLRTVR